GAGAARVEGAGVLSVACVAQIERPHPGKGLSIATRPGRQDAVKHVYPSLDCPHQVVWLSHPHQVARSGYGQLVGREIERREHRLLSLAYCEAPDRVAVEPDRAQRFGTT